MHLLLFETNSDQIQANCSFLLVVSSFRGAAQETGEQEEQKEPQEGSQCQEIQVGDSRGEPVSVDPGRRLKRGASVRRSR